MKIVISLEELQTVNLGDIPEPTGIAIDGNIELFRPVLVEEKEFSTAEEAEKMFQKLKQSLSGL